MPPQYGHRTVNDAKSYDRESSPMQNQRARPSTARARSRHSMVNGHEECDSTSVSPTNDTKALGTLNYINATYRKMLDRHNTQINKLTKELNEYKVQSQDLDRKNKDLQHRVDELERENGASVTKHSTLVRMNNDLQDRNEELENDLRVERKKYNDLMANYSELQRKERSTEQELNKAKDKIKKMHVSSKKKTNRTEERMARRIRDDERLLTHREQEIEELKRERDVVLRASINIREELNSARRRDKVV